MEGCTDHRDFDTSQFAHLAFSSGILQSEGCSNLTRAAANPTVSRFLPPPNLIPQATTSAQQSELESETPTPAPASTPKLEDHAAFSHLERWGDIKKALEHHQQLQHPTTSSTSGSDTASDANVTSESGHSRSNTNSNPSTPPSSIASLPHSTPSSPESKRHEAQAHAQTQAPPSDASATREEARRPTRSFNRPVADKVGILLDRQVARATFNAIVWGGFLMPVMVPTNEQLPIIAKMTVSSERPDVSGIEEGAGAQELRGEASIYEFLMSQSSRSDFDITPHYYGLFTDGNGSVILVLDDGGKSLKSFKDLTENQYVSDTGGSLINP